MSTPSEYRPDYRSGTGRLSPKVRGVPSRSPIFALAIFGLLLGPGTLSRTRPAEEEHAGGEQLMQTLPVVGKYTFVPNQLASVKWNRPNSININGHIEESFANPIYWPKLRALLQINHSAFGINAAEVGHLKAGTLWEFRDSGIGVSAEMPGATQCISGEELSRVELFGAPYRGKDIFRETFRISPGDNRTMPEGRGWFTTKDGKDYKPDEVVLDHRIDVLIPWFEASVLLDRQSSLNWTERKVRAWRDSCPMADHFAPGGARIENLIYDFVAYQKQLRLRYSAPLPAFSFYWAVNPGWELRDEQCLDALAARFPQQSDFEYALRHLTVPCHHETRILEHLIDTLCSAKLCPKTVYMDTDLTYDTTYSLDALRRNKAILQARGVGFGLAFADECNEKPHCVQISRGRARMALIDVQEPISENLLDQQSLRNKMGFLVENGVIDADTHIRFESWTTRPHERRAQVAETNSGSFANSVLKIFEEFLIPRGWATSVRRAFTPSSVARPRSGSRQSP